MNGNLITISDNQADVQIAPVWGGALTSYNYGDQTARERCPILRPWDGKFVDTKSVFSLANNVMLPWCNRIGAQGFKYDQVFYPIPPNLNGEKYPIHGDGFLAAWEVIYHDISSAVLRLQSSHCPPYVYEARLQYSLNRGALQMAVSIKNLAAIALPYGIGFHPWFVRTQETQLQFDSQNYWTEDGDYVPHERRPCIAGETDHFNALRALPDGWINTAFEGWGRSATLSIPNEGLNVAIRASETLGNLMVYSPSGAANFVCLEPMSHIPNAHCLPNLALGANLSRLEPGKTLEGAMWICPGPQMKNRVLNSVDT
jgi:aldose 1-epimerase